MSWSAVIAAAQPSLDGPADRGEQSRARALTAAGRILLPVTLWGAAPLLLTAIALATVLGGHSHVHGAGDFRYAFWPAGAHVLHGVSPYAQPGSDLIARNIAFVYPAVAALIFAPVALVPVGLASLLFMMVNIAAAMATLAVLDVRDWRLYGLALLCPAVLAGWLVGNVTLLLCLLVAVAWRYRDRPVTCGALIALAVSIKLFLWPFGLWLAVTRRSAALAWGIVIGVVINAAAWAVLGFGELERFGRLLHALTAAEQRGGYSVISLVLRAGAAEATAYLVAAAAVAACAVAMVALCRRGDEPSVLAVAIGITLLATPIVQIHYFALTLVPLAIVRPRLGLVWGLPLALWLGTGSAAWQGAAALALGGAVLAAVVAAGPCRAAVAPPARA